MCPLRAKQLAYSTICNYKSEEGTCVQPQAGHAARPARQPAGHDPVLVLRAVYWSPVPRPGTSVPASPGPRAPHAAFSIAPSAHHTEFTTALNGRYVSVEQHRKLRKHRSALHQNERAHPGANLFLVVLPLCVTSLQLCLQSLMTALYSGGPHAGIVAHEPSIRRKQQRATCLLEVRCRW